MVRFFRRVLAGIRKRGQGRSASPAARPFRPEVEGMEGRLLLSAAHLLHHPAHHPHHGHHTPAVLAVQQGPQTNGPGVVPGGGLGDMTGQVGQQGPVAGQPDPLIPNGIPSTIPNLTGVTFSLVPLSSGVPDQTLTIQSVTFAPFDLDPFNATFTGVLASSPDLPFTGTLSHLDANTTQIRFNFSPGYPVGEEWVGTISFDKIYSGNHLGVLFHYGWTIDAMETLRYSGGVPSPRDPVEYVGNSG